MSAILILGLAMITYAATSVFRRRYERAGSAEETERILSEIDRTQDEKPV